MAVSPSLPIKHTFVIIDSIWLRWRNTRLSMSTHNPANGKYSSTDERNVLFLAEYIFQNLQILYMLKYSHISLYPTLHTQHSPQTVFRPDWYSNVLVMEIFQIEHRRNTCRSRLWAPCNFLKETGSLTREGSSRDRWAYIFFSLYLLALRYLHCTNVTYNIPYFLSSQTSFQILSTRTSKGPSLQESWGTG